MRLLLDTHAFVWWRDSPEKLSIEAFEAISGTRNDVYLSTVAVWEIQIKQSIGKIELKQPLAAAIEAERKVNGFQILPISLDHALYLDKLPAVHKDPFDRMLVAQASVEDLTFVSKDRHLADYGVKLLW